MAYAYDPNQDDQDKQQQAQQQGQPAGNATVLSGQSAAMDTGAGGGSNTTGGAGAQPKSAQSGMYTNLQSYLGANQGEGARMAGDVGNTVAGYAKDADKAGDDWHKAAAQTIADNTVSDTKGLTSQFTNRDYQGVSKIGGDDFNHLYNATYAGPKSHSDATAGDETTAKAAYSKVQGAGKLAQGYMPDGSYDPTASRSVLLNDTYGKGNRYTGGESLLDSYLVGASPSATNPNAADNAFTGIGNTYAGYGDKLAGLEKDIDDKATAAGKATTDARDALRTAVTGFSGAANDLVGRAVDKAAAENATLHDLQDRARKGDKDALMQLGYSPTAATYASHNAGLQGYTGPVGEYGFDPSAMVGQSKDYGAGDFLDANVAAAYPQLAKLLAGAGVTAAPKYDPNSLASTGGTGLGAGARSGVNLSRNDAAAAQQAAIAAGGFDGAPDAMDPTTAAGIAAFQGLVTNAANFEMQHPGPTFDGSTQVTLPSQDEINTAVNSGDLGPINVLGPGYQPNYNMNFGMSLADNDHPLLNNYLSLT